ncbi:MAG TPA: molecular chaperone HtpG [Anaerolineales bacterium]|nr:molecular chaperone HtpG [Anaerolineales bacterium]
MAKKSPKPIAFKAEIRQLLDILIHSLYSDREIFLREIVSNASDALNRLRFEMLTNRDVHDPDAELAVHITADKDAKTITITDTGIGMTAEELTTNLGTIAQSGAREFIKAAQESQANLTDIIGQFGVGFYSAFMVAESVTVISRSYQPDAEAAQWVSSGGDTFTVTPAEKAERGTTIIIQLKEDAAEYADEWKLRQIVRKHSDFVAFPVYVGEGENRQQANHVTALWRQPAREVKDEEYDEFYKQLTLEAEKPLAHTHIVTDAPVQLYALLFIPGSSERGLLSLRREDGLKLYARKVLIQDYYKDLLPEYYRFVQGVVDSEDIPLNVSRELVQNNPVMARLKKILTGRVTSMIKSLADDKEDTDKYATFWMLFGDHIKQGIAMEQTDRESLYPLLRFRTTSHADTLSSLNDYVGRMKPGQKKIYYLLGDDSRSMARSPHLDYFRESGYEVILFTDIVDSFMLLGLQQYEGFDLQNVAAPDLELPAADKDKAAEESQPMPDADFSALVERFKTQLGDRVSDVRATERLRGSIARLVDPDGTMGQEMQRVYKILEKDYETPKKVLELNPRHPTLAGLGKRPADDSLAQALLEQIYDSALLIEGLHPDPASMIPRIEQLMAAALGDGQ